MPGDIIAEGDFVVLVRNFDLGNMKLVPAKRGATVHYGRLHFDPEPLIGETYGSAFVIDDTKMTKIEDFEAYDRELSTSVSNRVGTFSEKSLFSQEKIIKKKKQKSHFNVVTAIKPTLMLMNDMLYARSKLGGLRSDILSQILTHSNIQNGTRCLLYDHNLGPLTCTVMSRILPAGLCVQLVADNEVLDTTRETLHMLNIKKPDYKNKLLGLTLKDFYKVLLDVDNFQLENDIMQSRMLEHRERLEEYDQVSSKKRKSDGECVEYSINETESASSMQQILLRKDANREQRNQERIAASIQLKGLPFDSLIIVVQHDHPLSILQMTYKYLAPSRQFVIHSDTVEPLLECQYYLKSNNLAVSLMVSESWLRHYQVLPDRTRPEMNTSGYGGYLLSGTKAVIRSKDIQQSEIGPESDIAGHAMVDE